MLKRHEQTNDVADLAQAITLFHRILPAFAEAGPNRGAVLYNLSFSLRNLYRLTDEPSLIDEAIETAREAVATCADERSSRRAIYLNNLSISLQLHYRINGVLALAEEAADVSRQAVSASTNGKEVGAAMNNLGIAADPWRAPCSRAGPPRRWPQWKT